MFFRKKRTTTCHIWTSADGKYTSLSDSEKQMNDFLCRISQLTGVSVSEKQYHTKEWETQQKTDYICVKVTYPKELDETIWSASRLASVVYSCKSPIK